MAGDDHLVITAGDDHLGLTQGQGATALTHGIFCSTGLAPLAALQLLSGFLCGKVLGRHQVPLQRLN